jgi:hypothetical protein
MGRSVKPQSKDLSTKDCLEQSPANGGTCRTKEFIPRKRQSFYHFTPLVGPVLPRPDARPHGYRVKGVEPGPQRIQSNNAKRRKLRNVVV